MPTDITKKTRAKRVKKPTPTMAWSAPATLLQTKLVELEAAGSSGFEGLMRDILIEVTGQSFYLAKSGPQGGSDVRNSPANFVRIGLEAKRYQPGTSLPLDQLKAKIVEAAHEPEPVDAWILAATREISVTDREGLREIAISHGMKVVVWDWPAVGSAPPPIALLLASCPAAVANHLGSDPQVREALRAIADFAEYTSGLERIITELRQPDIGYLATAAACKDWLERAQGTTGNALAYLRGHHDLRRLDVSLVDRTQITEWLQSWWSNGPLMATLLGLEGVGKTWAALAWWNSLANSGSPPLTVFVSAKDVLTSDPRDVVACALAKQTELNDQSFWLKRLSQWRKASPQLPILVILDGLNQNWTKSDWADFLQQLAADDEGGRYRVLMTCWPSWWEQLGELASLHPVPITFQVKGFTDQELKENLRQNGITDGMFTKEMKALLRIPRLFDLALRYRVELTESGDVTAERLAYEDWKHRLKQGSARPGWSDAEFKDLISELGRQFREALESVPFSKKQLMENIGSQSGATNSDLMKTVQDLIAGQWLERAGGPHQYRISKEMAPYALGLALASELKGLTQKDAASTVIAKFVDPYRGQQLIAAILRAAVTAALIDSGITQGARAALVVRWLHEQNFGASDFHAWWRLMGLDVKLFLDIAEESWLYPERSGGIAEDEVFIKGFANACQYPAVASMIQLTTARWLGWIWGDPEEGKFDPNTPRSQANRAKTLRNFSHWDERQDKKEWPVIELRKDGNMSWLAHRAVGLLSFLPRVPQHAAFEAWAISRGIMGIARHFDELAWVVRFNHYDSELAKSMIADIVDRLLVTPDEITRSAANWLLSALGDAESLERVRQLGDNGNVPVRTHQRKDDPSPFDPSEVISEPLNRPSGNELWLFPVSTSSDDQNFERLESQFCRVRPSLLKEIFSEAADNAASRSEEQLVGLAKQSSKIVILLSSQQRIALVSEFRRRANGMDKSKNFRVDLLEGAAILDLWGFSASEQWKRLKADNFRPETFQGIFPAIADANDADIEFISNDLVDLNDVEVEMKEVAILFLQEAGATEAMREWQALWKLVLNDLPRIRLRAIYAAAISLNLPALSAFVDTGWTAKPEQSREEYAYCSLALSAASDLLGNPELLSRAHPEIWGWRLQHGDESEVAFENFNRFVRDQVSAIDRRGSFPVTQSAWNHAVALKLLVEKRPELLLGWLVPWLEEHESMPNFLMLQAFPLLDLAKALIEHDKPEGLTLWQRLLEAEREGFCKNADVKFMPLGGRMATDETFTETILSELITDDKFRDFAYLAQKNGHSAWLSAQISSDIASPNVGKQARGWTLLGFSDASDASQALWHDLDNIRPARGWLLGVSELAKKNYEKNRWARHWHAELMNAKDDLSIYAAFTLFSKVIDPRANLWRQASVSKATDCRPQVGAYWRLNAEQLNKASKDAQNGRKDRLFGLPIMRNSQAPWL